MNFRNARFTNPFCSSSGLIKISEIFPVTRSQNPCLQTDKRPEEERERERVQWLIAPKDSPTVRQGIPICSPPTTIFLLPFCVSRSWHSYKAIFITWHDPANFLPAEHLPEKPRGKRGPSSILNPPKFSQRCTHLTGGRRKKRVMILIFFRFLFRSNEFYRKEMKLNKRKLNELLFLFISIFIFPA